MPELLTEPKQELTTEQIQSEEARLMGENPFNLVRHGFLTIKTKSQGMKKLYPNTVQKKFLDTIEKLFFSGKPVRILVLKARQMGMCLHPSIRVLTKEIKWESLESLKIGQEIIGTDEFTNGHGTSRKLKKTTIEAKKEVFENAFRIKCDNGEEIIATAEHRFLSKKKGVTDTIWKHVSDFKCGDVIKYVTHTWNSPTYEDGWMSGILDGEGSLAKPSRQGANLSISQIAGAVLERIKQYMIDNKYTFRIECDARQPRESSKFGKQNVYKIVLSRIDEIFRIIGKVRPSRFIEREWWKDKSLPGKKTGVGWAKIISIESIGKMRMIDLQTSTKTFIAEGFVSHNSTVIEAIIYAFTSRMKGINAFVIADDLEGANYIFEMQKMYQEYLDKHLKPRIKHSNEKKLAFAGLNSQILIDTADNPNIGRKFTLQFAHLSEAARFTKPLEEILSGLGHAVPNSAGTMIFLETTANGYNEFYDLWTMAMNGKSDWLPLFYAWHEFPEYSLPLEGGKLYPIDNVRFSTPMEKENFLIDEKMIKEKYHLTDEQLNWRRWDLVNNCSGDVNKFNEDNPSCPQDAFVATGNLYFNREALKRQEIKKPLAIGNIVKEEGRYIFRQDPVGLFKIYEYPLKNEQYVVAGDPAEGLEHGDKTAGIAINKRNNKTVCVYNHNIPPDRFEEDLAKMGHYYNEAIIACENKGYGYSVNQDLYKHYGKVYRKIRTKKGFTEPTLDLGFNTNSVTRPQMLAQLAEEIAEGSTDLLDVDLISQCWTFINNIKRGQPEAEKGKCDDLVLARSIAGQVRIEQPYKEKFPIRIKKRHFRGLSGY